MARLKVYTNRSARPLEEGGYGEYWICLMWLPFMNCLNSAEVNCGPLSETSCSGNPNCAKSVRKTLMVFKEVVACDITTTSGHLEWALTTMKNILPMKGPAKSTWRLARSRDAVGQLAVAVELLDMTDRT